MKSGLFSKHLSQEKCSTSNVEVFHDVADTDECFLKFLQAAYLLISSC